VIAPSIAGVHVIGLSSRSDDRGSFVETFRQEWLPGEAPSMVQANLSSSRAGVLRGLHFHRVQADYWCVLEGSAFVALYDLRRSSPTEGVLWTDTLVAGEGLVGLYVPPGVAHGFFALTDVRLQYQVDTYYTGDDELGISWDDDDVAVPWPAADPVLSDRDANAPSLAQLVERPVYGA
jgi:dTDP-4-dehydrorhamnose 3,5-epimerase